jgi:hypothetical protein
MGWNVPRNLVHPSRSRGKANETHDRAHQGQGAGPDHRRVIIGTERRRLAVPRTGALPQPRGSRKARSRSFARCVVVAQVAKSDRNGGRQR